MRSLIIIAVVLVALVVGGLLIVPRLVVWDDYREELTRQAEALTGQPVEIGGHIELSLLPRPTLSLADTSIGRQSDAPGQPVLHVDRLEVQLEPWPLLRGAVEVGELHMVRPVLHLERAADGGLEALAPGVPNLVPLALPDRGRLSVIDGRAVIEGLDGSPQSDIDAIDLDLRAEGERGPYTIQGDFRVALLPFHLDLRLGRVTPEATSPLQLQLRAEHPDGASALSFRGVGAWSDGAPRLDGELTVSGKQAAATAAVIRAALGRAPAALPSWLETPFRLAGRLSLEGSDLRLAALQLSLADTEASGQLELMLAARPRLDLTLDATHVALPAQAVAEQLGLGSLAALPAALTGKLSLSIGALDYRGDTLRRVRLAVALPGDDRIAIEEARAVLPGLTDASFKGEIKGLGAKPELEGSLTAVSGDLRSALAWFGIDASSVPEGQLRTFSLSSQLALDRERLRLSGADLRIDGTRITGSLALGGLSPGTPGARRQIAATLAVDRLDLDDYRKVWRPAEVAAAVRSGLGALDAALEVRIDRLVWGGAHLQDVLLQGRSLGGRLRLDQLAFKSIAEADARLTGEVELSSGSFDLTAKVTAERPTRLLRRAGIEPPLVLTRLAPVVMEGSARGRVQDLHLDIELSHDATRVALAGTAGWNDGKLRYDLALDGNHPDYRALLRALGVPPVTSDEGPPRPLSVTGKLEHEPSGGSTVAGTARLGETGITGRVSWQQSAGRPQVAARLSIGEPRGEDLGALAALLGVPLPPGLAAGPPVGNWPDAPLPLGWTDDLDGELQLSAKGGVAGEGLQLAAHLEDQKLTLDQLTAGFWGGELELKGAFETGRPLPFLTTSVDLRGIEATRLAGWLDVPPVIEGPVDLHAETTAAGGSLSDLVRGLIGKAEVSVQDGRLLGIEREELAGIRTGALAQAAQPESEPDLADDLAGAPPGLPLDRLDASFEVKRGIATTDSSRIALDGLEGRLSGQIDLLLWAADLRLALRPNGGPGGRALTLHLVGPLDAPQVRYLPATPSAPPASTTP